MARINVDSDALQDPRIVKRLPRYAGLGQYDALGRLLQVWALGYARKSVELTEVDIEEAADHVGFAGAMVQAGLAELVQDAPAVYRVAGLEARIGYLVAQSRAASEGGRARAEAPRRSGRFVRSATIHQPPAGENQPTAGEEPADHAQPAGAHQPSTSRSSLLYSGSTPDLDLGVQGGQAPLTLAPAPSGADPGEPRGKQGGKRSRSSPKAVETPIPEDFAPGDAAAALAVELRLDLAREVAHWRDKAAAAGWTFKDHQAGLRTWLRNAAKFRERDFAARTPPAPGLFGRGEQGPADPGRRRVRLEVPFRRREPLSLEQVAREQAAAAAAKGGAA